METNMEDLLNLMDETLEESASVPFTGGKRMVDIDKVRDIIDEIRLNMPGEIRRAKAIVQDRTDILAAANREADAVVKRAEERARSLIAQEAIVKAAAERASDIMTQAQTKSREVKNKTTEVCEAMLRDTEEQLTRSAAEVKNLRQKLHQSAKTARSSVRKL